MIANGTSPRGGFAHPARLLQFAVTTASKFQLFGTALFQNRPSVGYFSRGKAFSPVTNTEMKTNLESGCAVSQPLARVYIKPVPEIRAFAPPHHTRHTLYQEILILLTLLSVIWQTIFIVFGLLGKKENLAHRCHRALHFFCLFSTSSTYLDRDV